VGYYLIDKGQAVAGTRRQRALALAHHQRTGHPPVSADVLRRRHLAAAHACSPRSGFCGGHGAQVPGWKLISFFTLVFLLCASQLAVALMNWLSTLLVKPRLLPRLDYSSGIAPECRTMVVVPTMLTSLEAGD
jgi:cyclic beta-1,2-glucan synthetase